MILRDILYGIPVLETNAEPDADVKDVVNNSDKTTPGALFCAYRGEHKNGEEYIKDALDRKGIIVSEHKPECGCKYITVPDAKAAYAELCANLYDAPQKKLRLFAVTGTNGKTTTTSMLYHVITKIKGEKSAVLIGGVGNIVSGVSHRSTQTTPDPHELYRYLSEGVRSGADYGVLEASSHALDYKKLVPCRFDAGAMTNLTEDHLDYHKTLDNYFNSKKQLIPLCDKFVSNGDDVYTKRIDCPHFSLYDGDFTAKITRLDKNGAEFVYHGMKSAVCKIGVCGKFNVYNALTALCLAELAGFDAKDASSALSSFDAVAGRFEMHRSKNGADIIIDYAHTPDALENALIACRQICRGRLICVFGCGGDRDRNKRRLMGAVSSRLADFTVITADNSRSEDTADIIRDILKGVDKNAVYTTEENRKNAIIKALLTAKEGDTVLLAGKGHEDYEIDKNGAHPFSEARIINDFNCGGDRNGNNDI